MKQLSAIPRLELAIAPTPLQRLDGLSKRLGRNVYIKRDDMTGVSLGGNKVRKLEYLLADAKAKGADTVLTTGGAQSNHAMLTAACANRAGMRAVLVLKARGVCERKGNLILNDLLGADVRFVDADDYASVYAQMDRICAALRESGHTPYAIPVGGSVPLGTLGYVRCAAEIAQQMRERDARACHIVCAVGSGGTHAGLHLGASLHMPQARVWGIAVDPSPLAPVVHGLMKGAAELIGAPFCAAETDVRLLDMTGPGYAISSPEGEAAMRLMAQCEGLILDPVYTGKAFAGLLRLAETGAFGADEDIVFVHTGGAGGVFALA